MSSFGVRSPWWVKLTEIQKNVGKAARFLILWNYKKIFFDSKIFFKWIRENLKYIYPWVSVSFVLRLLFSLFFVFNFFFIHCCFFILKFWFLLFLDGCAIVGLQSQPSRDCWDYFLSGNGNMWLLLSWCLQWKT